MDTMDLPAVGTRISLTGYRGTVRFAGPVNNTKGVWLGVEWDDPDRGKHNGVKDGKQYFECRYVVPSDYTVYHSLPCDLQSAKCRVFYSAIRVNLLWSIVPACPEIEIHRNATWFSIARENSTRFI